MEENKVNLFVGLNGPGIVAATIKEAWKVIDVRNVEGIFVSVLVDGLSVFIKDLKKDIRLQTVPIAIVGSNDSIFYDLGVDECYLAANECSLMISDNDLKHFANRRMQKQKRWLDANTDGITGCFTRKYFDTVLEQTIHQLSRDRKNLSLIMIDIDFFKQVNDNYGHQCGDEVLRKLALLMKDNVRPTDIICRYGGEEFGIILPHTGLNEAFSIAEQIRMNWQKNKIIVNDCVIAVTISAGVSSLGGNTQSSNELIKEADEALYLSKTNGRNQVQRAVSNSTSYYRF